MIIFRLIGSNLNTSIGHNIFYLPVKNLTVLQQLRTSTYPGYFLLPRSNKDVIIIVYPSVEIVFSNSVAFANDGAPVKWKRGINLRQ